jgi:competence protein ComEC
MRKPLVLPALVALSVAFGARAGAQPPAAGTFRIHAIDVGSGLSMFVEGQDFALLYDAGSIDDRARGDRNRVIAYLRAVRPDLRRIDHLILSHPHLDHTELMPDILSRYEIANIWDSGAPNGICSYELFLEKAAAEPNADYHHATGRPGAHSAQFRANRCYGRALPAASITLPRSVPITAEPVRLGAGARMSILRARPARQLFDLHDASLVVRLELGTRSLLLPGDADAGRRNVPAQRPAPGSPEAELLSCCGAQLRSDILVVGAHGSRSASSARFLDAVRARYYLVSAGPTLFAGIRNPDLDVVMELASRGTVWRTDKNDEGCKTNRAKIGIDNDGRPGGCDNVRIVIDADGVIAADYNRLSD